MHRQTIKLVVKKLEEKYEKENEIKQEAFLKLKENANELEADVLLYLMKNSEDDKDGLSHDGITDLSYDTNYISNVTNDDFEISEEKNEEMKYFKKLGFDVILIKNVLDNEGPGFIILKDDILNYIFEGDPIYSRTYKRGYEFTVLKEDFEEIINDIKRDFSEKTNEVRYTFHKAIKLDKKGQ